MDRPLKQWIYCFQRGFQLLSAPVVRSSVVGETRSQRSRRQHQPSAPSRFVLTNIYIHAAGPTPYTVPFAVSLREQTISSPWPIYIMYTDSYWPNPGGDEAPVCRRQLKSKRVSALRTCVLFRVTDRRHSPTVSAESARKSESANFRKISTPAICNRRTIGLYPDDLCKKTAADWFTVKKSLNHNYSFIYIHQIHIIRGGQEYQN